MEKIDRLELKVDEILKNIDEMKSEISKIIDSVYDPDNGLYIRVHNNTEFRKRRVKFDWLLVTIGLGILVNMMLSIFSGN